MNILANRGDVIDSDVTTLTNTTETALHTAGGAGIFYDLVSVVISNTSASAVRVDFKTKTGANVKLAIYVPAGETRGAAFTVPKNQETANTAWTATLSSSVTDVRIAPQFLKRNG